MKRYVMLKSALPMLKRFGDLDALELSDFKPLRDSEALGRSGSEALACSLL